MVKTPAPNERFCVIAAISPKIMQCKLVSYYPAGSSVEAAATLGAFCPHRLKILCRVVHLFYKKIGAS